MIDFTELNSLYLRPRKFRFVNFEMVVVAQLVRALDCGSRGRGFEPHHPPCQGCLIDSLSYFYSSLTLFTYCNPKRIRGFTAAKILYEIKKGITFI